MKRLALGAFVLVPVLAAGLAIPLPAEAYVRTRTSSGAAVRWRSPCLTVRVHAGAPPAPMTTELFLAAARAGAAAWSHAAVGCTETTLFVEPSEASSSRVAHDRRNNVTFRRDQWCRDPRAADEPCYDPAALAITTIFAQESDGAILDADIEVNAVQFTWDDLVDPNRRARGAHDIQNTLTHELGHLIGLDHNCYGGLGPHPTDDQAQPAPSCGSASTTVRAATMFPAVVRGDVERRTLAQDDLDGVCGIYPLPPSGSCTGPAPPPSPDAEGGCRMAQGRGTSGGAPFLVLLGLALAPTLVKWARRAFKNRRE